MPSGSSAVRDTGSRANAPRAFSHSEGPRRHLRAVRPCVRSAQRLTRAPLSLIRNHAARARGRDLSDNLLSGSIPVELGALTALESLYAARLLPVSMIRSAPSFPAARFPSAPSRALRIRAARARGRWLNNNRLDGEIPLELGALAALDYLYAARSSRLGRALHR